MNEGVEEERDDNEALLQGHEDMTMHGQGMGCIRALDSRRRHPGDELHACSNEYERPNLGIENLVIKNHKFIQIRHPNSRHLFSTCEKDSQLGQHRT